MKAWPAALLVALALAPVAAANGIACSGGETVDATPLPGGYYLAPGAGGAQELWYEHNSVPGLQRTLRSCSDGSFTDADWKIAAAGGLCVGVICGL